MTTCASADAAAKSHRDTADTFSVFTFTVF